MLRSNTFHRNNNPNSNYPKSSKGQKGLLKPIWDNRKEHEGSGVIVIQCDPNALLERLDLLLASKQAGHTGVGNALVSICDELKGQGVLDSRSYENLISIIMIAAKHGFYKKRYACRGSGIFDTITKLLMKILRVAPLNNWHLPPSM